MGRKIIDLTGRVFGELTVVVKGSIKPGAKEYNWVCKCSCGNTISVRAGNLKDGKTKSCGCHWLVGKGKKKSGEHRRKVYSAWDILRIKYRLSKDSGIISSEFLEDFEVFYEHIGDPPSKEHVLRRIDPRRSFERNNLEWVLNPPKETFQTKKYTTNTSGVTGVSWCTIYGVLMAKATWVEYDPVKQKRTTRTKCFSANKYGKDKAFELACEVRQQKIEELSALGQGKEQDENKIE
jgi:hypothetical protein